MNGVTQLTLLMGNYQDSLHKITSTRGKINTKYIHPSDSTWILNQAKVTKLLIPEVEYLWAVFKKLGCTSDGFLTDRHIQNIPDPIMRNMFLAFKAPNFPLSFENYLRAVVMCSSLDVESKIRASFHFTNNGQTLDKNLILKIVQLLYPDEQDDQAKHITEMLFEELDEDKTGFITEEQFVKANKEFLQEETNEIFELTILPKDLQEDLDKQLPEFCDCKDVPSLPDTGKLVPSDSLLGQISKRIATKDWKKVVNKLGFLSQEIENLEKKYPDETSQLIFEILLWWKEREGEMACAEILEKALLDCNIVDVAILLAP